MPVSWIDKEEEMLLHEYKFEVIIMRIVYYGVLFVIISPLLLKKNLDKLKPISLIFLLVIILLIVDILIEAPFFYSAY